ncbi:Retrovirus-related Pol polyprotein from transposon opus [Acropora cervicornis]|uniref:Retrovirus-related Pol polyprotein from transposon opus n=1 Tax=Acropora cervicornis TaxID=6130 RepID=A0AAD9Q999_ACRCE|nr:Retrovirus-related Pol polyprotein from transposon opus [Acropora cervicornis]
MGLKIDDRKVEAVKQMQAPKDKKGLQSFQGMVNYLKRYSAQLTRLFQPLKPLLLEDIEWSWDSSHKEAFDGIKEELTRTPVLAFFNPKAEHVIQTDASLKGLGAVLLQEGRPVVYVSRTLTPAEERYSNIERQLLGVVFSMWRLHNYVYGGPVRVQTDYKPLGAI